MSCHQKVSSRGSQVFTRISFFHKGKCTLLGSSKVQREIYMILFPWQSFLPPPFFEKFKSYKKVKLSHSYFPELTVNIWSYFSSFFFFVWYNIFQIPNIVPSTNPLPYTQGKLPSQIRCGPFQSNKNIHFIFLCLLMHTTVI